jgi:mannan endo-1,4-beta-mannosidase
LIWTPLNRINFNINTSPPCCSGANVWELVEAAAGAPKLNGASIPIGMTGPELVRNVMTTIKDAGLNTVRLWAHSVNPEYELMRGPGEFNENIFRGLDLVMEEARRAGLKVNLAFGSQWTPVGGVKSYLKQAGLDEGDIESFYTDPAVKDLYKSFIEAVLSRTNTVNGRIYSEDPTIFMLDIINENRCQGCTPGVVTEWYHEMADYIKTLDTNHLVTTGQDGFYGPSSVDLSANPGSAGSAWASREGQDFIADHDSPAIDVAVIHSWPDK